MVGRAVVMVLVMIPFVAGCGPGRATPPLGEDGLFTPAELRPCLGPWIQEVWEPTERTPEARIAEVRGFGAFAAFGSGEGELANAPQAEFIFEGTQKNAKETANHFHRRYVRAAERLTEIMRENGAHPSLYADQDPPRPIVHDNVAVLLEREMLPRQRSIINRCLRLPH